LVGDGLRRITMLDWTVVTDAEWSTSEDASWEGNESYQANDDDSDIDVAVRNDIALAVVA